MLLPEAFCS